jgi:hypothetical protein
MPIESRFFKRVLPLIFSLVLTLPIGISDWINVTGTQEKSANTLEVSTTPVAYIYGKENTLYTTIEKALDVAVSGEEVIVIPPNIKSDFIDKNSAYASYNWNDPVKPTTALPAPNLSSYQKNYTISSNCTIKAGVTLHILNDPRDTTDLATFITNMKSEESRITDTATLYYENQSAAKNENLFLRTNVKIADGKILTNNGTLLIDGLLSGGGGGQPYSGQTAYSYSQITLGANAKIVSNSSSIIYAFGYIKESATNNGSCVQTTGTSVYMPFVLRDFRGGSSMSAIYSEASTKHCSPFNQFEMPNIQSSLTLTYTSSLIGVANLYASNSDHETEINLIGSSSSNMIQLSDANYSSVKIKYNNSSEVCVFNVYGGSTTNKMSMNAAGTDVTTENVYFPISFRYDIHLCLADGQSSASFSMNQMFKIMTGATFTVDNGVTLSVADMIVYSNFTDDATNVGGTKYPTKSAGIFTLNGTLNATNFAGLVQTAAVGASLTVSTGISATTNEAKTQSGSSFLTSITVWNTISENLRVYGYSNTTNLTSTSSTAISAGTYPSAVDSNGKYGFSIPDQDPTYKITITLDTSVSNPKTISVSFTWSGNTISGKETGSETITGATNYFLTGGASFTLTITSNVDSITVDGSAYTSGTAINVSNAVHTIVIKPTAGSGTCLAPSTKITLANGTTKPVEEIKAGDSLRVFNHETGKVEEGKVVFNDQEPAKSYVFVNCLFSNGSLIKVQYEHGFFNVEENKYVYIRENNYADYIGKHFATFDTNGNKEILTLSNAYLTTEVAKLYSPVTEKTLNYFTEGVLSMPGGITGLFNIFDVDPLTLKYDETKKEADIKKYGLLTLGHRNRS